MRKISVLKSKGKIPSKIITPVVLAGIIQDNNILLLKRDKVPYKGLWSLPGGKIGPKEFITDALRREVFEETNLSLISIRFMGIVSELISDGQKIINGHLINVFWVEASRTKIKPSSEGYLKWFKLPSIKEKENRIIPTDFLIISNMLLKKRNRIYTCLIEQKKEEYFLKDYVRY